MTNPNDPVSPQLCEGTQIKPGLTKLEHFAAMAMQGLLANPVVFSALSAKDADSTGQRIADASVEIASALVAALNAETPAP